MTHFRIAISEPPHPLVLETISTLLNPGVTLAGVAALLEAEGFEVFASTPETVCMERYNEIGYVDSVAVVKEETK